MVVLGLAERMIGGDGEVCVRRADARYLTCKFRALREKCVYGSSAHGNRHTSRFVNHGIHTVLFFFFSP